MASITIRVPDWMKWEMDRHREVNWSEIIRDCIRSRLAEFKHVSAIEELVERCLNENNEVKLRTLDIFATVSDTYYVFENVSVMYGERAVREAEEVLNDLREIGIVARYNKIGDVYADEAMLYTLDEKGVHELFRDKMSEKLANADMPIKEAVWLLSQYNSTWIVPEGFVKSFKILCPEFSGDILKELIKLGVLYKDYHRTVAYRFWRYVIPEYAKPLLEEISDKERETAKEKIIELIKSNPRLFRDFLEWMGGTYKWIPLDEEAEIKRSFKETYGKDLDEVLSILVKSKAIVIDYWPERRRAGRRKRRPPEWIIKMTSVAMSFDVLLELIRRWSERSS